MIAVIDYGMGNLRSVEKALQAAGGRTKVTSSPQDIGRAEKIVFPGVGAFGEAIRELKRRRLVTPIKDAIARGAPFLGLCLGLQLLFEKSEEAPGVKGLCVLKGEVKRFRFTRDPSIPPSRRNLGMKFPIGNFKVPHMGWNNILKKPVTSNQKPEGYRTAKPDILKGVRNGAYMYFVHSYYVVPKDKGVILTTTDYGGRFVSGIAKDNVYAFQFHPEKSQEIGLKILENFVRLK